MCEPEIKKRGEGSRREREEKGEDECDKNR
jgi:hypothetical protein